MERRNRGSGHVDEVACRECGAPIALDSAKMLYRGDHAAQPCDACGAEARLRLADLNRPPVSEEAKPARFHVPPLLPEEPIPIWPKWLTDRKAKGPKR